jgi:hypothetical protein
MLYEVCCSSNNREYIFYFISYYVDYISYIFYSFNLCSGQELGNGIYIGGSGNGYWPYRADYLARRDTGRRCLSVAGSYCPSSWIWLFSLPADLWYNALVNFLIYLLINDIPVCSCSVTIGVTLGNFVIILRTLSAVYLCRCWQHSPKGGKHMSIWNGEEIKHSSQLYRLVRTSHISVNLVAPGIEPGPLDL